MIIEELLNNLKECDDFHNRCDYLLEHNEITYLLGYIRELKEKYNQLLDDEELLQMKIDKAIYEINEIKDIIIEQPTGNDEWILGKLQSVYNILKGEDYAN